MFRYEPQGLSFFRDAPLRLEERVRLRTTRARAFEVLADAGSWPRWFPLMHRARWLTDAHAGEGAEREVSIHGLGTFRERFLAWEPGARFAVNIYEASSPLAKAVSEDYVLVDDGPDHVFLEWTFAARPSLVGRALEPVLRLMMRDIFRRAGRRLQRYLDEGPRGA